MKKSTKKKTRNIFIGVLLLGILILGFYFSTENVQYKDIENSSPSGKLNEKNTEKNTSLFFIQQIVFGDNFECFDDGFVRCGDTQTCGINSAWCENFLNPQKSCLLTNPSWCCNNAGYIIDYSDTRCCPPEFPFLSNNGCYQSPQLIASDNFYTRSSDCSIGEEFCKDKTLFECKETTKYIYNTLSSGITKGKCGVECFIGEEKCEGTNYFTCTNNIFISNGEFTGKCGVSCVEKEIQQIGDDFLICSNEQLVKLSNILEISEAKQAELLEMIKQLEITTNEKVKLIEDLTNNIEGQILIINNLNLQITEQAEIINQLTQNLQTKAKLVEGLQIENDKQAELISEMKLSFSNQAEIINSLNNTIEDDSEIIKNLNLNINDQSELISKLKLTNDEQENIINNLELTIDEQKNLINNLEKERLKLDRIKKIAYILVGIVFFMIVLIISLYIKRRK